MYSKQKLIRETFIEMGLLPWLRERFPGLTDDELMDRINYDFDRMLFELLSA